MLVLHSHQIHIKSLRQKQLRPACLYCQSFEIILVSPLTNRIIHQRNHIVRKSCAPQVLQNSAFQICHELHHHPPPLPRRGVGTFTDDIISISSMGNPIAEGRTQKDFKRLQYNQEGRSFYFRRLHTLISLFFAFSIT